MGLDWSSSPLPAEHPTVDQQAHQQICLLLSQGFDPVLLLLFESHLALSWLEREQDRSDKEFCLWIRRELSCHYDNTSLQCKSR